MREYSETSDDKNSNDTMTIFGDDPSEVMDRLLHYYCSANPELNSLIEAEIAALEKS